MQTLPSSLVLEYGVERVAAATQEKTSEPVEISTDLKPIVEFTASRCHPALSDNKICPLRSPQSFTPPNLMCENR